VAEMIDVSHEMAAEEALRAREKLLRRLAEALPIGVLQATADGRIVYTNERLHQILGTSLAPDLAEQLATVACRTGSRSTRQSIRRFGRASTPTWRSRSGRRPTIARGAVWFACEHSPMSWV